MEKKGCKLAITQFEFELEAVVEDEEKKGAVKQKFDRSEIELLKYYFGDLSSEELDSCGEPFLKLIEEKDRRLKQQVVELYQEQVAATPSIFIEPAAVENLATDETKKKRGGGRKKKEQTAPIEPVKNKGGRKKKIFVAEQEPPSLAMAKESVTEIIEKETDVELAKVPAKKKIGRPKKEQVTVKTRLTWNDYFEKYKNGERSHAIDVWASQNRKEYKTGKMNEDRKDMLIGIRFPLMFVKKERKRR